MNNHKKNRIHVTSGSSACVGLKYPVRAYEAKWGIFFYFQIGDGVEGHISASCWFKEPGAMRTLASLPVGGVQISGRDAWISEPVGEAPGGFAGAIHRALDTWIEVWRKAGGIEQFLPNQKIPEELTS